VSDLAELMPIRGKLGHVLTANRAYTALKKKPAQGWLRSKALI
jgi:hypothetical protein